MNHDDDDDDDDDDDFFSIFLGVFGPRERHGWIRLVFW